MNNKCGFSDMCINQVLKKLSLVYLATASVWLSYSHAQTVQNITLKNDLSLTNSQPSDTDQSKNIFNNFIKSNPQRNINATSKKGNVATSKSSDTATLSALAASAVIAPVVPGCATVTVGYVYNDTTPPVGSYKCYQFVINAQSK